MTGVGDTVAVTPSWENEWTGRRVNVPGPARLLVRGTEMADGTCSVDDCERIAHARGFCPFHYLRWKRNGDPTVTRTPKRGAPSLERFRSYVSVDAAGCWLWQASVGSHGYGSFWEGGKNHRAHKWGYEHMVAPVPDGLQLDHLCRVRHCVNPEHLEPVTAKVNQHRSTSWSGTNAAKTHCKWGHEFTPENTRLVPLGRACKACAANRAAARRARAKT